MILDDLINFRSTVFNPYEEKSFNGCRTSVLTRLPTHKGILRCYLLGIDVDRHKGRDGYGLNERIFRYKYEEEVVRSQVTVVIDTKIKIM